MKKILLAGVVGGLVLFLWSSVSHMLLPIGELGIRTLPNEEPLLSAMSDHVAEPGFYFFPGIAMDGSATAEEQAVWQARYEAGPTGVLVLAPTGKSPMSAATLLSELLSTVLAALFVAWILSNLHGAYMQRVFAVALIGAVGWLAISVSHWGWYSFPLAFTIGEGLDQVVGWLLAGFAMAAIVPETQEARLSAA